MTRPWLYRLCSDSYNFLSYCACFDQRCSALRSGRPLRGVLFWRWDLQVYANTDPADYGVRVEDTTFDLIKENADQLKVLSAQQPPNVSCKVGCWVPEVHAGTFSTVNRCAQMPSASTLLKTPVPGEFLHAPLQNCHVRKARVCLLEAPHAHCLVRYRSVILSLPGLFLTGSRRCCRNVLKGLRLLAGV